MSRICLIFLISLAVWVWPSVLSAHTPPTPELSSYELWLREAFAAAQRGDRLGLQQIASSLIETTHVQAHDGTLLPVDNQWLADALEPPDPDLPMIAARLGALLDALTIPEHNVPTGDPQQQLDSILNHPPFAANAQQSFVTQFLDWLSRMFDRMFQNVGGGPVSGVSANLISWLMVVVSFLLIIGTIVYLFSDIRRTLTRDAQLAAADNPDASLTANDALQQATTLAHGGDYRTAMRYLYLSSLLWLDERALLRYDPALTNREYLASLAHHPELHAHLMPIVETFDHVWYGSVPLDADSFARYRQDVDMLRRRF